MKKIFALMIAALMLCSFVFVMSSCTILGGDDTDGDNNQNNNSYDNDYHVHTMSQWTTVTVATCTTAGSATRSCIAENCTHTETRTIDALGHDLEHHEADAPECNADGHNAYDECTRCDYSTYTTISATGHSYAEMSNVCTTCGQSHICDDSNFTNWHVDEVADCTTAGKESCKCSVCNFVKEHTLPKTGHSYGEDGKCADCGAEETDVPELPDAEI